MTADQTGSSGTSELTTDAESRANQPVPRYSVSRSFLDDLRLYSRLKTRRDTQHFWQMLCATLNPGLWLLTTHRLAHFGKTTRRPLRVAWWLAQIWLRIGQFFNALLWRSDIARDCEIARGVYLPNDGYLICGAKSIGSGSIIQGHCTFGQAIINRPDDRPIIGNNVWVGENCIIAGAITIGNGATILPGTFLTFSVEPRTVVQGNPGRIVLQDFDNQELRQSIAVYESGAISAR